MNPIEALLRRQIGLDVASVGSTLIERTIRLRMKAHGLAKTEEYRALLETSPAEWEELLETVVVTETWFFRNSEAFSAFAQLTRPWRVAGAESRVEGGVGTGARLPTPDSRRAVMRVLCIPCASGEEPYSLAMTLLDAGVPSARFRIDAVDISARGLARARAAVYGKNSFRGQNLAFRERHFTPTAGAHALRREVRECVQFHRGNLLQSQVASLKSKDQAPADPTTDSRLQTLEFPPGGFDFIFCRNLLIYFDRATQDLALQQLSRRLAREGVLFVGPAELPLVSGHGFVSANLPMAFACRKAGSQKSEVRSRKPKLNKAENEPVRKWAGEQAEPRVGRSHFPNGDLTPHPSASAPSYVATAPNRSEGGPTSDLATARQLADAGRLTEAAAICESHLQTAGPSAHAYYLLGLVLEAVEGRGSRVEGEAGTGSRLSIFTSRLSPMDYYRKAIYLEPNHYETLLQMSLLLEKNGDAAGARTLKRRAERISMKNEE